MHTPAHWSSTGLTAQLLRPLSWLYRGLRHLHREYRLNHCYYAGIPVISIGNLTVGGTGKTPLIRALAEHFAARGQQVAILSRGYGGSLAAPTHLTAATTAAEAGDEPVMLFRQLADLPVQIWVGRDRIALAERAERAGATLLLLDDGFQRDDLARTVDIVVLNGLSPFGNGYCLPAGPLREPVQALTRADFAVVMNPPPEEENRYYNTRAYRLYPHWPESAVAPLKDKKLVAFAGLGNPEKFFTQLRETGLNVAETVPFADHHFYTEKDLHRLHQLAKHHKAELVTTEKDLARLSSVQAENITALPLELTGDDWENILAELAERLR